jgi:predicted cupin superfamily sugar epimerase
MKPTAFIEHPEGGRFQEVFRSSARVTTSSGQNRSAITHIYFSLNQGEVSRFHKVSSDEIWSLYKGSGIRIYTWDGTENMPTCTELSAKANVFCHVVPAGEWQAAEPIGESALVGCSVGPGFEFDDFQLMDPASDEARALQSLDPRMSTYTGP